MPKFAGKRTPHWRDVLSRPQAIAEARREVQHDSIRLVWSKEHAAEFRLKYNEAVARLRKLGDS